MDNKSKTLLFNEFIVLKSHQIIIHLEKYDWYCQNIFLGLIIKKRDAAG